MGARIDTLAEAETNSVARNHERRLTVHVALLGERPTAFGRSYDLTGVSELVIGRGDELGIAPDEARDGARLDVPDQTISSRHARLRLDSGFRAVVEDLGSRNGTRVRGERLATAPLVDGDWFALGRTVFIMRASAQPLAVEAVALAPDSPLKTFLPRLAATYAMAAKLAPSRVPLLLVGETGVGKDLLAKDIHTRSGNPGPLVTMSCAALPDALVEDELFGFSATGSGVRQDVPGLVRAAEGGTLLLDEIGDLPASSQAKLLRVLQQGEIVVAGDTQPTPVNVRIIATAQQPLEDLVRVGRFRADLLGRLAGFSLMLPPLRERLVDLGILIAALLKQHAGSEAGRYRLTSEACIEMFRRKWPLNIRQLESALASALVLARDNNYEMRAEHLGAPSIEPALGADQGRGPALREKLIDSLTRHGGNVSAVARELGKARMQIHRWMDHFGVDPNAFRKS